MEVTKHQFYTLQSGVMLLESLRCEVLEANLELVRRGLVLYTFGNASGISRAEGLVAVKPSGVPYEELRPEHIVVTDLDGRIVEGKLRPSSDLATHLVIYRAFPHTGGVVHTHSRFATAWAQAGREIPCLGTTHADYFRGAIPVTEPMPACEIEQDYEHNTGIAIVRRFEALDAGERPGVLVAGHGPFAWGPTPAEAAHNAVIIEELAQTAYYSLTINPAACPLSDTQRDKHFLRKHGAQAYYGQV
ncbi:MAG: L-ribulose-5-phosphate 4-epimerase AraD [Bryobacterales bacterium]|nr:L-ribulose-5-phosphate 4-epimerase AraD [Bryobacterales bacterium]